MPVKSCLYLLYFFFIFGCKTTSVDNRNRIDQEESTTIQSVDDTGTKVSEIEILIEDSIIENPDFQKEILEAEDTTKELVDKSVDSTQIEDAKKLLIKVIVAKIRDLVLKLDRIDRANIDQVVNDWLKKFVLTIDPNPLKVAIGVQICLLQNEFADQWLEKKLQTESGLSTIVVNLKNNEELKKAILAAHEAVIMSLKDHTGPIDSEKIAEIRDLIATNITVIKGTADLDELFSRTEITDSINFVKWLISWFRRNQITISSDQLFNLSYDDKTIGNRVDAQLILYELIDSVLEAIIQTPE